LWEEFTQNSHTRTSYRALFNSESFPIRWICNDSINHEHVLILYVVIHSRLTHDIDFMYRYSFMGILSKAFALLYVFTIFCINVNYSTYKDISPLLLLLYIIIFTNYINFIHFGSIYVHYIRRLMKTNDSKIEYALFSRCSFFRIWARLIEPRTIYSTSICRTSQGSRTPPTDCKRSSTITSGVFEVSLPAGQN